MYKNKLITAAILMGSMMAFLPMSVSAQVDYSVLKVNEESGLYLTKITNDNDYVCMPEVRRSGQRVNWLTNRIIDIAKDNNHLAYLSARNNTTNIFIKEVDKQGASVQRTNRSAVLDFSYSPDGKYICFSEASGKLNQIYQTSATEGYVCRQFTSGNQDYSPVYSSDMKNVYFSRMENNGASVWSYNIASNYLSSYTSGFNPCPSGKDVLLCTRMNTEGRGEIWRVNYESGVEECVVSDPQRSFSTPSLSPDGQWLLFVGSNVLHNGNAVYANTDIFACKVDGTHLVQLTFHAADDLSPVWSKDGHYIYFISQRGSTTATANVWRMNFVY